MNTLLSAIVNEDNKTLTNNGAPTFKSTLNHVLDLFAMGGALRTRSESEIIKLFSKAFAENDLLALKCLFNIRNIRGGAGERRTFRVILKYLGDNYPKTVAKNFQNIAEFGRFDDLLILLDTKSRLDTLNFIEYQLISDINNFRENKPISLLAKWLPSENASSAETKRLAGIIRQHLKVTSREYRKTLTNLRQALNIVEVAMSSNQWSEIEYSKVPSKANLKYKKAFSRHDPKGYTQFIQDVKSGKTKINSAALFPYEIVAQINPYGEDNGDTLDVLWDALPNYLEGNERNMLCVCDVSGSMSGTPMNISVSLGIYTAERNKGPFGGYFITYSSNPVLQKVVGKNIREKVRNLQATAAYSTNLQAVFDMILKTAIKNKVEQKDMPAQILVITDVEFNSSQNGNTNLQEIQKKYKRAGYAMPQLVFWNVNSVKNNVPATADEKNVLLVSGASPSVFKTLLTGKQYTPVDQMMETLNQKIYDKVVV